jgi:UDP-glucose 4-epimerase
MRVLVTGASGFLGGALTARLLRRGWVVIGTYQTVRPELPPGDMERLEFVRSELSSELLEIPRVDLVIHAAGRREGEALDDLIRCNVLATQRVAEYARKTRPQLVVYLSSISVYGEAPEGVLSEGSPRTDPGSHGLTKHMGELLLAEKQEAFPTLSLRLPEVAGSGCLGPWLGALVGAARRGEPLEIRDPGALFNATVDVAELERLILHAAERRPAPSGPVNVATRDAMPAGEVARMIVELTGSSSEIRETSRGTGALRIDTARLEQIGFVPERTAEVLRRQLRRQEP